MDFDITYSPDELLEINGNFYDKGTVIKFKKSFTDTYLSRGLKIWPYAGFSRIVLDKNGKKIQYTFSPYKCPSKISNEYSGWIDLNVNEFNNDIVEEVYRKPISANSVRVPQPKSDFEIPGMLTLWAIYIIVMVASMIFRDFIIIWAFASYGFFKLRKELKKP